MGHLATVLVTTVRQDIMQRCEWNCSAPAILCCCHCVDKNTLADIVCQSQAASSRAGIHYALLQQQLIKTSLPDEVRDHICPVTKYVKQTLLALILHILATCKCNGTAD